MNDPNWQQHPQQYHSYPFNRYQDDWGRTSHRLRPRPTICPVFLAKRKILPEKSGTPLAHRRR
jgi:hypothetical protein